MSTIKTTNIGHPSAGSDAITLASDGGIQFNNSVSGTGLDHIVTQSFTAASSVSVDDCFSADYNDYRIIITETYRSTSLATSFRFRTDGTDNTSAIYNYKTASLTSSSTSVTWGNDGSGRGQTSAAVRSADSNIQAFVYDIKSPFLIRSTDCMGHNSTIGFANITLSWWGSNSSTSFDGLSFIASTGTFSGTISVYGYKS